MSYLTVLILIFGFCSCLGNRESFGYRNHNDGYRNNGRTTYYSIIGSDYDERKEDIWRPCSLDDYDCMGHFLSSNSECVPAHGYTPDPIITPIEKFYFPVAKMTVTNLDVKLSGFKKAKVVEFYVNKATGNVVIAVAIPNFNFTSTAFFSYQRTAKEPITLSDYDTFELDKSIITAVIPRVKNLRLDIADIHADIPNTPPRYYIGPKAYTSHDPAVKTGIAKFEANVVEVVKEALIPYSYFLMSTFIQAELCDFGLDSYRNHNGYYMFRRGYNRY